MGVLDPELRKNLEIYESPRSTLVRDPISAKVVELDALQFEIARRMDGRHSPEDIAGELAKEYEAEIPPEAIRKFEQSLGTQGLLARMPGPTPINERTASRASLKVLRRDGLTTPATEHPDAREAFDIAMRLLDRGEHVSATNYLSLAAEIDPASASLRRARDVAVDEGIRVSVPSAFPFPRMVLPHSEKVVDVAVRLFGFMCRRPMLVLQLLYVSTYLYLLVEVPRIGGGIAIIPTNPLAWALSLLAVMPLVFLHELAHAVTCRHFGGKVTELGMMLIFGFFPAAYADVSSAHSFEKRSHRLWTTGAGLFVTLQIGATAGWITYLTPVGTPLHDAASYVFSGNLIVTIVNLSPFVPLDGYYLMMDFVGVENLRLRAIQHCTTPALIRRHGVVKVAGFVFLAALVTLTPIALGQVWLTNTLLVAFKVWIIARLLRRRHKQADPAAEAKRVDEILESFGIGARMWTVMWIGNFLGPTYEMFVSSWRGAGFVLFFVIWALPKLSRLARGKVQGVRVTQDKPRDRRRAQATMFAGLVAAGLVLGLWPAPKRVYVNGRVAALDGGPVRAGIGGVVQSVEVRSGQRVDVGQTVVRLRDPALAAEIVRAEAALDERRAALALAQARLSPEQQRLLAARVAATRTRVQAARERTARLEALRGLETGQELGAAQRELAEAGSALGTAMGSLRGGALEDPEEIAEAQATVAIAEIALGDARARLQGLTVRSPWPGIVVTRDLEQLPGSAVAAGDSLLEVYRPGRLDAELLVPIGEAAADLQVGMTVTARLVGAPDALLRGRLEAIDPTLQQQAGAWILVGRANLRGARSLPLPGASLQAAIHGRRMTLLHQLALPTFAYFRHDFWQLW